MAVLTEEAEKVVVVVEAVVVMMKVAVPVGKEARGFLMLVMPVAVAVPLVVQLMGLKGEVQLERIKLDRVFGPMKMETAALMRMD